MSYTITTTVGTGYDDTVAAVRSALADVGFGVLTEIDMRATLRDKLGVDVPAQVILGACRPPLAHRALQAEPAVAGLLPCNVVVRALDAGHTAVEAIDPVAMLQLAAAPEMPEIAAEARDRLARALAALGGSAGLPAEQA